jgi:hypothetical protein
VFNVNIEVERKEKRTNKEKLAKKPEEFSQHLWNLVDEDQQKKVKARYSKFSFKEYLLVCVTKILKELDTHKSDAKNKTKWIKETTKEASEEDIMRKQALAYLDIYFLPTPKPSRNS